MLWDGFGVGLAHLKQLQCHAFKNCVPFEVQDGDVLSQCCHHQLLTHSSSLACWASSRLKMKLAAKLQTGNVLEVRDGKPVMMPAVDEVVPAPCASMVSGLRASFWEG